MQRDAQPTICMPRPPIIVPPPPPFLFACACGWREGVRLCTCACVRAFRWLLLLDTRGWQRRTWTLLLGPAEEVEGREVPTTGTACGAGRGREAAEAGCGLMPAASCAWRCMRADCMASLRWVE